MSATLEQMAAGITEEPKATKATTISATDKQIADMLAAAERERLQRRAEIRAGIAQQTKLMAEVASIADQIKLLDQRSDAAAERHRRATEPIQAKLLAAEGEQRTKLLGQLTDANVALETELDVITRVRDPLHRSHRVLRTEAAGIKTAMALGGADVGNPILLAEMFSASQRLAHAQSRVEVATSRLQDVRQHLALVKKQKVQPSSDGWVKVNERPIFDVALLKQLLRMERNWSTELTHASAEEFEAKAVVAELESDLRNE